MTKFLFCLGIIVLSSSCTSLYNYQVFKTTSPELNLNNNQLVYEDTNCTIYYDLWSENGNPSFLFFNKSKGIITIDLSECFFVMNGISYDYYQQRVFTQSSSSTVSNSSGITKTNSSINTNSNTNIRLTGNNNLSLNSTSNSATNNYSLSRTSNSTLSNSSGYSVSYNEQKIVKIPSNSGKVISEFQIAPLRYRHCDLHKVPTNREGIDSVSFDKSNSPFVFSNHLSYELGDTVLNSKKTIINEFFVHQILNMEESTFFYKKYTYGCDGKKSEFQSNFYKYISPNNFYISYPIN